MAGELGKTDLAARVAAKLKGTHSEGNEALKAVLDAVTEALRDGHRVTLTGFGTFDVRKISARKVRAIRGKQQGQLVDVPAHARAGFRAGTELQRAVEGK